MAISFMQNFRTLTFIRHGRTGAIRPNKIIRCMARDEEPIRIDLRKNNYAMREPFRHYAGYSLFARPLKDIRLICREFPWIIEIKDEWVTCGLVWKRIHETLRRRITNAEWALILNDKSRRRIIEKAMRERLETSPSDDPVPLRIDYLGDMTVFLGLEKDEVHAERISLPARAKCETWAIRLGSYRRQVPLAKVVVHSADKNMRRNARRRDNPLTNILSKFSL